MPGGANAHNGQSGRCRSCRRELRFPRYRHVVGQNVCTGVWAPSPERQQSASIRFATARPLPRIGGGAALRGRDRHHNGRRAWPRGAGLGAGPAAMPPTLAARRSSWRSWSLHRRAACPSPNAGAGTAFHPVTQVLRLARDQTFCPTTCQCWGRDGVSPSDAGIAAGPRSNVQSNDMPLAGAGGLRSGRLDAIALDTLKRP